MSPARLSLIVILTGVTCGVAAAWFVEPPIAERSDIEWLSTSRPTANFVLPSTSGDISNARLNGQWTLMGFGYLSCPNACPTMLGEVKNLTDVMTAPIEVIFVSVDPDRDTLAAIAGYLSHFDNNYIGAVGDKETTAALARSLGVQFTAATPGGIIGHSVQYALLGPDGTLAGLLRPGFDPTLTAADLSRRVQDTSHTEAL